MTGIYNVLEQLRRGEALSAKEREIHERGLVAVLAQLHDELDAAVLEAYDWHDLAPALIGKPGGTTPYKSAAARGQLPGFGHTDSGEPARLHPKPGSCPPSAAGSGGSGAGESEPFGQNQVTVPLDAEEMLLTRLVALNAERAAEEARGIVRWLRPEFQNPQGAKAAQETLIAGIAPEADGATPASRHPWPKALSEQVRAVRAALAEQPGPATPAQLAKSFKGAQAKRVTELLQTLDALGQARATEDGRFAPV
jgi:hypothetical protein